MGKKNKRLKKIKKQNLVKVKNNKKENNRELFKFNIVNVVPAEVRMPNKYYTAKMEQNYDVDSLNKNDILIIDPTIKNVIESGIYLFEFRGHLLVRQFQVIPFGEHKNTYRAIGEKKSKDNEYYPIDEVNILGTVISKYKELIRTNHNNAFYGLEAGA